MKLRKEKRLRRANENAEIVRPAFRCENCKQMTKNGHFVPESLGEAGFFACKRPTIRLDELTAKYRPGSENPPWDWDDERKDLLESPEHAETMAALVRSIEKYGEIFKPILIGDDGRIWDGHHRIIAAMEAGLEEIPYTFDIDEAMAEML